MIAGATIVGLVLLSFVPGTASAGDIPKWRIGPGSNGSGCIGDTSRPVCALETWLACHFQDRPDFHEVLGMPRPRPPFGSPMYIDYQVMAEQPVDAGLVARLLKDDPANWAGVMEVCTLERFCEVDRDCSGYDVIRHSRFFKPASGGNWVPFMIAQGDPNTMDCRETPDSEFEWALCRRYVSEWVLPWVHEQDYDEFDY